MLTKLYPIPKFGVNIFHSKQNTAKSKLTKKNYIWPSGHCPNTALFRQRPDGHTFLMTFLNGCVSVKASLINTILGDFVNISVLFMTMCNLRSGVPLFFGAGRNA